MPVAGQTYEFGPFRLDAASRVLLRDRTLVSITPKVFDTLVFLVANAGRTVSREELIQAVWPDTFVEEGNLNYNLSQLRKILGEPESGVAYIQTIPKRGYRFVAEMAGEKSAAPAAPVRRNRRLWFATAGVLIVAAGSLVLWRTKSPRPRAQQIRSIAVLPLRNLSHDPDQEYLADGMTEALTTGLAQISALSVIARTSMTRYSGTKKAPSEIARELHVDALVEGSVQRSGGRVMITANLIDGSNDHHLWAKSFERDAGDALALQNDIAQAISLEIQAKLTSQESARLNAPRPVKPDAQEAFLRAVYWYGHDFDKAFEYAQQATLKDPDYGRAQALLATYYAEAVNQGKVPMKDGNAKWRLAVRRALELDDGLAEAHNALGYLLHLQDWNWRDAEKEYQRAIQLNPSLADAYESYADLLCALGRADEAVAQSRRAVQVNPFSAGIYHDLGSYLVLARQYDAAIEHSRTMLAQPGLTPANTREQHMHLGAAYFLKGEPTRAIQEFQDALKLATNPADRMFAIARLGYVYGASGYKREALQQLAVLKQMRGFPVLSYEMAVLYGGLGENDRVFQLLDKAFDERPYTMTFIKLDPRMDGLRSDPRYSQLLRRMGLPE